jgi:hypothetical protein
LCSALLLFYLAKVFHDPLRLPELPIRARITGKQSSPQSQLPEVRAKASCASAASSEQNGFGRMEAAEQCPRRGG